MKRKFIRYILGIFPAIALFHGAYAQKNLFTIDLNDSTGKEVVLNTKAPATNPPASTSSLNVNAKALKDLRKQYTQAGSAHWSEIESGFLAEFSANDIQTKVFYDLKGRWTGTLRTYQEDKLPANIRHMVKSHYYDYDIFVVNEVRVEDKKVYLVKIEDKKNIKTIRVMDDEMDEYESLKKSN